MNNYTHIWGKEREIIYLWLQIGLNQKEIAGKLNRNPSSICREIKRNRSLLWLLHNNNEAKKFDEDYHYLPNKANEKYKKRRQLENKGQY
jgi:IS30 family transposase